MGKKICLIIVVLLVIIGIDYLLVRYRNTRPLFAIQDGDIYVGLGYKAWHCKTETGGYQNHVGSFHDKYACPVYETNAMVKEENSCTFVKTFYVLNNVPSNEEDYEWLVLRQFQMEPILSVKVSKKLNPNIEVGKNYEFMFEVDHSNNLNDDNLFQEATLIRIEETDKVGLEQVQTSCP